MSWVYEICRYKGDLILGGVAETVEPYPGWIDFLSQLIGKASSIRLFRDACLSLLLTIPPSYRTVMGLRQAPFLSSLNYHG